MNEERLKQLEALCEKATKGPWLSERFPMRPPLLIASGNAVICEFSHTRTRGLPPDVQEANCALIVEARTAIPDLINRVRELERALEQAVKLGEFELGELIASTNLTTGEECSDDIGQMFITRTDLDSEDWPVSEAPDLHKWLEEKGK